jgi:2-polyprenyl-6-methoxyphenol hydroxylase-like FAD-dependent oxidoreductase
MPPARFRQARPAEFADLHLSVIEEADGTFAETLRHGRWSGRLVAFPGRPGFLRQAWGPGWALVGDAGCFKDPITAHGMTDALRDAGALARAVTAGTDRALAGYEEERDTFAVPFLDLSDAVASFAWDYEEVQALHLRLGKLMNNECDHLRAVERSEEAATAGAAEPPAAA